MFTTTRWNGLGRLLLLVAAALGVTLMGRFARAADLPRALTETGPAAATRPAGPAPRMRCAQPTYEFTGWAQDKVSHDFIVSNDGDAPLKILAVKPSCGCTVAGDYDRVIAPGKQGKIPLSLTLHAAGPFDKDVTVTTDDPATPELMLFFKGEARARLTLDPPGGANFGSLRSLSDRSREITITNNTDRLMKLEPIPASQPAAGDGEEFGVAVKETEAGKQAVVTVTIKKAPTSGFHSQQVQLKTGLPEEPELILACGYTLPPAIEVLPTSIYGHTYPQAGFTTPIVLNSNRDVPLKIEKITSGDDAVKANLETKQEGKSYLLRVSVPAGYETPTSQPVELTLGTNSEEMPEIKIPVRARRLSAAASQPEVMPAELIGNPAPEVTLQGLDGDVKIGGKSDHIRVVNFWSTRCYYSRAQLPVMERVRQDYEPKGVQFINVSEDGQFLTINEPTQQQVAETARKLGANLLNAFDPRAEATPLYAASSTPIAFVIGKSGVVEAMHWGMAPTLERALRAELDLLLAGKTREAFPKTSSQNISSRVRRPTTRPK